MIYLTSLNNLFQGDFKDLKRHNDDRKKDILDRKISGN